MMRVVRMSHSFELIIRFCIFFLFAAMLFFIGVPEGLSAPQKAPTVKDLIEEEPKKAAPPATPAVEAAPQAVTKGALKEAPESTVAPEALWPEEDGLSKRG